MASLHASLAAQGGPAAVKHTTSGPARPMHRLHSTMTARKARRGKERLDGHAEF
jgi:hypothetical protein